MRFATQAAAKRSQCIANACAVFVIVSFVSSCIPTQSNERPTPDNVTSESSDSPSVPESEAGRPRFTLERDCDSAIYSEPHDPGAWDRDEAARILAAEDASRLTDEDFAEDSLGRRQSHKFVLEVNGTVDSARIAIAPDDRSWAGLAYEDSTQDRWRMSDVPRVIHVKPCGGQDTQFNGGIAAERAGCLTLHISEGDGPVSVVSVPMGVPRDNCSPDANRSPSKDD